MQVLLVCQFEVGLHLKLAAMIDFCGGPSIIAVVVPTPFVTFAVILNMIPRMQSLGVWSLNHDLTTSLGLSQAPIFQKSIASQGAKTLFISNMDVGCNQWDF